MYSIIGALDKKYIPSTTKSKQYQALSCKTLGTLASYPACTRALILCCAVVFSQALQARLQCRANLASTKHLMHIINCVTVCLISSLLHTKKVTSQVARTIASPTY